ncbi:hypothetical protein DLAC_04770 [Tieghemostelium lacteum]|uniref:Uncharacterized protein n=1 Tax=Tieghemostelium lacteum TaxID=361077 RepID=A0A151ZKE6_TIELA|nr:hypothetical protein DLAC_04770 [Tieghemostelium lacteum]|eukprot:KYQ94471.1 hypothetical protein DLAC_04770 [Tieghemostelium lacteum]
MLNKVFEEQYVLSATRSDKEKLLSTLINGSPDYYFYNALHLLNVDPQLTDNSNKTLYRKLMADWRKTGSTGDLPLLQLRKKLLRFNENNQKSCDNLYRLLKDNFGLTFTHSPTSVDESYDTPSQEYPTKLNPDLVDKKTIIQPVLDSTYFSMDRYNPKSLPYLLNTFKFSDNHVKQAFPKIKYPVFDEIVNEIVKNKFSFNSYEVISNLTLPQMDQLQSKYPEIVDASFIKSYLVKLLPGKDENEWKNDPVASENYFKVSMKFVNTLPKSFNQIKFTVLYHYLQHQITLNQYDDTLIQKYFEYPRSSYNYNDESSHYKAYQHSEIIRFNSANLIDNYPPVSESDDEKLLKQLLRHKFLKIDDIKPFLEWFKPYFLKGILAETRLLEKDPNEDKWTQLLDHGTVQKLKDRVDIEFLPTNAKFYHPDDGVQLKVAIKNVQHLIVKVFEINTYNFYKMENKQIDANVKLDGLVASEEFKFEYTDTPIARVVRDYQFPSLKGKRGIFVLEFIGNGKSSRALIRKGELNFITETTHLGQLIKVLDEDSQKLSKASVWVDGNTYKTNENGDIQIPFTTYPSSKSILLVYENFSTLKTFDHKGEQYTLSGGIYLENGSLIYGERAQIAIRAKLFLNGTQISTSLLEESTLTLTSTDNSSSRISNSKEIKPFVLSDTEESVYSYKVQENLSTLSVNFQAKIRAISRGNVQETLQFSNTFTVGTINESNQTNEIYFKKDNQGFKLCLYGKGGEPIPNQTLNLEFRHWCLNESTYINLQTDKNGIIDLGPLDEVHYVNVYRDRQYQFYLDQYRPNYTYPCHINAKLGDVITLPYFGNSKTPNKAAFSLFELAPDNKVSKDLFSLIKLQHEEIQLQLPAGEFKFFINDNPTVEIDIVVCDGDLREDGNYIVSPSKIIGYEPTSIKSLQLVTKVADKNLQIKLKNYTPDARVVVTASHFVPTNIDELQLQTSPIVHVGYGKSASEYFSGRELGDEINYIFNRKNQHSKSTLPGNSLKKPSLLMQPFSVSKTDQSKESLSVGTTFGSAPCPITANRHLGSAMRERRAAGSSGGSGPFLEFLGNPTSIQYNLKPNNQGEITLPLNTIEQAGNYIRVTAIDSEYMFNQLLVLDHPEPKFKEIKLTRALDPLKHFKEEKLISTVQPGQLFEILNVDSSKFALYDTLDKVMELSKTLTAGKTTLQEFSFIANWASMTFDQKKEKFSKYTCHELNFFIYKKDKEFFEKVVLPFVECKMNKTFIDFYLTSNKVRLQDFVQDTYKFNQLNTLEKILLGEVFPEHAKSIENNLTQLTDFLPIKSIHYDDIFKVALNQLESDIESAPEYTPDQPPGGEGGEEEYNRNVSFASASLMDMEDSRSYRMEKESYGDMDLSPPPPPPSSRSAGPPPPVMEMMSSAKMKKKSISTAKPESRMRMAQPLYQQIEKTQELAETNYYNQLKTNSRLIPCNEFWRDYITHINSNTSNNNNAKKYFLSKYIAFTNSSFTESIMALSVLDIPLQLANKDTYSSIRPKDGKFSVTPITPIIIFHKELVSAELDKTQGSDQGVFINQNFFDINNRYSYENNENVEIYVKDEFLTSRVYGCLVVIANLTSRTKKLDILFQIPKGAIPVGPHPFYTKDSSIELSSYSNTNLEYYFYFPSVGRFSHFPAHICEKGKIISSIKPFEFNVVSKATIVNTMSWQYVANRGTPENIIEYLEKENLYRTKLHDLYHRLKEKNVWEKVIKVLKAHKFYDQTVWSYSIFHKSPVHLQEYLSEKYKNLQFGRSISSPLVRWNPLDSGEMNYFEYSPLVNSRTHQLGNERKILNDKFANQYTQYLNLLSFKENPSDSELLSVAYYLILQDRFNDSAVVMNRIGKVVVNQKPSTSTSTTVPTTSDSATDNDKKKKKTDDEKKKEKEEKKKLKEEEKKKKEEDKELKKKLKEEEKKKKEEDKKKKKEGIVDQPQSPSTPISPSGTTPTPLSPPVPVQTTQSTSSLGTIGFDLKTDDDETLIDVSTFNQPANLPELAIQFDYLVSYLDFFNSNPVHAKILSKKYQDYPVQRWNALFKDMKNKIDQINDIDSIDINYESEIDRERAQAKMATNASTFDISVEGGNKQIAVNYSNCTDITACYYVMDIELLFSSNPFVQQGLGQFLYVVPNKTVSYPLTQKSGTFVIEIPQEFQNKNIMVDCHSANIHHNLTVYSNNLSVMLAEKAGQLRVINRQSKKSIPKAYVKVYAKLKSGTDQFWKDGYSDISGYFDYSTVSSGNITDVAKFSILVLSEEFGSLIKEAKPPGI